MIYTDLASIPSIASGQPGPHAVASIIEAVHWREHQRRVQTTEIRNRIALLPQVYRTFDISHLSNLHPEQQNVSSLPWAPGAAARHRHLDSLVSGTSGMLAALPPTRASPLNPVPPFLHSSPINAEGWSRQTLPTVGNHGLGASPSSWSSPEPAPKRARKERKPTFPMKLMTALMRYEQQQQEALSFNQRPAFAWLDGGRSFIVLHHDVFREQVLRANGVLGNGGEAKYDSFVRRTNRWCFERTTCEIGQVFHHPLFCKGRMDLG